MFLWVIHILKILRLIQMVLEIMDGQVLIGQIKTKHILSKILEKHPLNFSEIFHVHDMMRVALLRVKN